MTNNTPSHAMPGPHDTERIELDNGLVILVRENHSAPVTVLEGSLPAGSIHTTGDQAGLASFTASMLMRGSQRFDFDTFNERIEGVGANLSVSAGDHSTDFGLTSLSEDFPMMVELLADTLRRPTFPEEHIERVKSQTQVSIQERDQDTQQVASLRFYETLYGDHPYGRSNLGYAHTVRSIGRQNLVDFHANHFTPDGAVMVITGDVDAAAAVDLMGKYFEDWTGPKALNSVPPVDTSITRQSIKIELPDKVQSDIVIGCHAISRHHPDFHPIRVANTILGRFGTMGRLGETVREEQGLAYYAFSSLDASPFAGVWLATAGVNPDNVEQAIESILAEFSRLGSERVSDEELSDSQAFMTGVTPLALETNEGVANTLLQMEWHNLGLDYLLHYNDIVYGVTAEDVQRVAATYLRPDSCLTVIAGPSIEELQ